MILIIGLGNPGKKYINTRHNFGAMLVSYIAQAESLVLSKQAKLMTHTAEYKLGTEKIILALPDTYMNLSGNAAAKLVNYFKLKPENVIVAHDDVDLPFGVVRVKKGGSAAGHHGVESTALAIGSGFWRFRLGAGVGATSKTKQFVLETFSEEEQQELPRIFRLSYEHLKKTLSEGLTRTTLREQK